MTILGVIADDLTGGTDVANSLSQAGMRTQLCMGLPDSSLLCADAIVICLKSRTAPVLEAVELSRIVCRWFINNGTKQIYFKYCSTFDSTPNGNIDLVADALLNELDADFAVICPAFPANGRTIYLGHIFVDKELLSASGMKNHPLTPMRDSDLVQLLQPQTRESLALVSYETVKRGTHAIEECRRGRLKHRFEGN